MSNDTLHPSKPTLRFGVFELDLEQGELRKRGVRIGLQEQPFRLLCLLAERPGQVITREELRSRIWSADTFVDFDGSLNIAVLKVRQALGDSATHPRFIETVPRRGYRFVGTVETAGAQPNGEVGGAATTDAEPAAQAERTSLASWVVTSRWRLGLSIVVVTFVALLAGSSVWLRVSERSRTAPRVWEPLPLTSLSGIEINPSLSADGTRVAFAWNGDKQDNFDVYISPVPMQSGTPTRLTSDPADDFSPAWSPDGQKIAFLRRVGRDTGELLLVAATGGTEHKLADICSRELPLMRTASLSWSPDGQWVAVSHREPRDAAEAIYAFSLTGGKRRLTTPPERQFGDHMPAFSADGKFLAFCRLAGFSTSEIYIQPLLPDLLPESAAWSITNDKRWSVNPVWRQDGRSLLYLYSEHPETRHQVRKAGISGSHHDWQILPISDEPREITATNNILLYSRRIADINIWRARIPAPGESPATPERLLSSTVSDEKPAYSPDGARIAFGSDRSGSAEIWVASAEGKNPTRLTSFGGPLVGVPKWSPDGQWLVFHARPDGQADVFALPVAGGSPVRLTDHPADDVMPSYSRDGRWIYFSSRRGGDYAIWKMSAGGGAPTRLTTSGGSMPIESRDGTAVYSYAWPHSNGIVSVSSKGGEFAQVTGPTHPYPFAYDVSSEGIFYPAPPHAGASRYIMFFNFATRKARPVVLVDKPFRLGMSVSPDGRFLAFDQFDDWSSDLMMIRDFDELAAR